jgi:hypothetical protein
MPALYTALAILGWLIVGLILFAITLGIAFYNRVRDSLIDFVAQLFEEEAREFADSDSRTAALANQIIDGSR